MSKKKGVELGVIKIDPLTLFRTFKALETHGLEKRFVKLCDNHDLNFYANPALAMLAKGHLAEVGLDKLDPELVKRLQAECHDDGP